LGVLGNTDGTLHADFIAAGFPAFRLDVQRPDPGAGKLDAMILSDDSIEDCRVIARYLHPGMVLAVESAAHTEAAYRSLKPCLANSRLKPGRDIFVCICPYNSPSASLRIVGGVTAECAEMGALLYLHITKSVLPVSLPGAQTIFELSSNQCVIA
jgi:UDP-N-acetyl-D-mannosaminuronate dehydrogenase